MQLPEPRPSWLFTVLFATAVYIFFLCLSYAFADGWLSWLVAHEEVFSFDPYRESHVRIIMQASGIFAAALSAFALRTSRLVRFHIAFVSGLSLLIVTCLYLRAARTQASLEEHEESYPYQPGFGLAVAPLVAVFSTATGLILIVAALNIDRLPPRPRHLSYRREA